MTSHATLDDYAAARDSFFSRLVERLAADERIDAAWLTGAHGRDEEDGWSDFDLQVAVRDADLEPSLSSPESLFALGGSPLLVQAGFPSDSIQAGKFWLVLYPGPFAVDWNIGPSSLAERAEASKLLSETSSVPVSAPGSPLSPEELTETAQAALEFFWAMAPIAIKYAGRGWTSRAVMQVDLLSRAYEALWRATHTVPRAKEEIHQNRAMEPALGELLPRLGTNINPDEVLRVVALFCVEVRALETCLRTLGVAINPSLPGEVERLSAIANAWASKGGSRPSSGSRR